MDRPEQYPLAHRTAPLVPARDPLRVVSIGGGTGLSALLKGLKKFTYGYLENVGPVTAEQLLDVSAIVTVSDDGGSSGRLRRELHVPPPGDIRNCLVALSEDEDLLSKLFQYRFDAGEGLRGHSFGNLFLTALSHVTGDFTDAVKVCSEVLAIAGRIYPSTSANVHLEALLTDGTVVNGETSISASTTPIQKVRLVPSQCDPLPEALEAIAEADMITLGPGSLFTSVIPNLLVQGIPEAIAGSKAQVVYISNLMWQPGETTSFTASDHVASIHEHAGLHLLDAVVLNTRPVPSSLLESYRLMGAEPVEQDVAALERMGLRVIATDLLGAVTKIRHDSDLLAATLVNLAREFRNVSQAASTSDDNETASPSRASGM